MPPSLTIQVVKRRPPKRPILRCIRQDGTETMAEAGVGVEHDLAHYAVETTLGLEQGFYGLLSQGMNIEDFDVQGATGKIEIPDEAVHVEFIVGLLQVERRNDEPYDDFKSELRRTIAGSRRPPKSEPPEISAQKLEHIRCSLDELLQRWHGLAPGESLELEFS